MVPIAIFQLLIIPVFILLNGFFVAAEMSLARVRRTRIDQLAEEGSKAAQLAQKSLDDPERFISACQLGITVATLALGAVGESAFADDLANIMVSIGGAQHWTAQAVNLSKLACFAFAFGLTAFFQTVLGELIPKTWTFDRAESVILMLIGPMEGWCQLTAPVIGLLNYSTESILKLLRVQEPSRRHFVHSEEELKMLVSASHEEGVLQPEEEEMLHSVFDFSDTVANEVMTPRTDMICVSADSSIKEYTELVIKHGHSRIPVYEGDMDNIFGLIHIRDGLRCLLENHNDAKVRDFARKILIVPENKNLGDLLTEIKKYKTHMAIVVDEYGSTRGLVTLEDLLEELVGDIADEHDVVLDTIQYQPDGSIILDAKISLDEANEKLDLKIEDEDYNTLGGHVFGLIGHEPRQGDEVKTDNYRLIVEESDRHRILKLRLIALGETVEVHEGEKNGHHRDKSEKNDKSDKSDKTEKNSPAHGSREPISKTHGGS
ncbi:MAG TPA: hemolysin family protein [Oculatellaceae cyanobacterium]